MKISDQIKTLRSLNVTELQQELLASHKEQFNLRMQNATKQLTTVHLLKQIRRKIARIYTIIQDKMAG